MFWLGCLGVWVWADWLFRSGLIGWVGVLVALIVWKFACLVVWVWVDWLGGCLDGWFGLGCSVVWMFGCVVFWLIGCLGVLLFGYFGCLGWVVWLFGCIAHLVWLFGYIVQFLFGCLVA